MVAIALAFTLSVVNFTTRDVLYSSDRESLRRYTESVEIDGEEYYVPLSQLSVGLGTSVEYETEYAFDEHITYTFYRDFCKVQINDKTYTSVEIVADRLTAGDGFFVYNMRYGQIDESVSGGNTVGFNYYAIRTDGDVAFYERVFVENYGALGRRLGGAIILVDGIVCAIVCLVKRKKYPVKL